MDPIKKNRFKVDNVEQPEEELPDFPGNTENVYIQPSTPPRQNKKSTFFTVLWTLVIVLIIASIGFGIWYKYFKDKGIQIPIVFDDKVKQTKDIIKDQNTVDRILEKPYLPLSSTNQSLSKCINAYRERYINRAFTQCNELLNSPASDEEKSIALTVIGVMYDESERFSLAIENLRKAVIYDPKNIHAYYNLAVAFKHTGQYAEAKNAIAKAKEISPTDSKVSLLAGNLLNETNDPNAAIDMYKQGINTNPNDPHLIYNLALSLYKQGSIPESIENFKRAIAVSPKSMVGELAHAHLGTIYYHRDDINGAEHHFREAVTIKPNNAKYLYNLGLVLFKKKNNEEAIALFQKALESGTNDPKVYRFIAESFEDLKMPAIAVNALQKGLRMKPDDIDTMQQLADLHYSQGNLSEAEEMFRKVVRSTPGDLNTENALVNLGIILDDQERYNEAIEVFEKAISLNPKNVNAYYNLGIAYKNSGQPTKAIENWRKANVSDPSNTKSLEAIGDYYYENGFVLESVKEYESISKYKPEDYKLKLKLADAHFKLKGFDSSEKFLLDVLNNSKNGEEIKLAHRKLALVYSEGDSKNKTKAKDEAYRGSHIDPDDMESRLVLAKVLIDSNSLMDREKAIDELTAVVRSDVTPKVASKAHNYLGLCYYKNGEFKKALREFQNAIDLDPTLTEAYDNKRAARASYEDTLENKRGSYLP